MFNNGSTVSKINRGEIDVADTHFRTVFEISRRVWELSDGRYDPTVAPLCDLWGFGTAEPESQPSDDDIEEALCAVGLGECSVGSDGKVVRKSADTSFDFSSVAKGYGVDCIAEMFDRNGVDRYMIEIGGEVRVRGLSPRGRQWRIQVDAPVGGIAHSRFGILQLGPENMAVATSGNYRNFRYDVEGKPYGHTLSPLTGRPAISEVLSATVLAPDCALADALATACMTMGKGEALDMLSEVGAEGLLIVAAPDFGFVSVQTDGFDAFMVK
ncbi:FAD:protein FMN transferase [Muribaculaceae bacterium]|nr:FAD:protein FMN transferase [Muribaculaceae bacterium]